LILKILDPPGRPADCDLRENNWSLSALQCDVHGLISVPAQKFTVVFGVVS